MERNNDKSPHILNAASNFLGICFVIITSLKVLNISYKSIIDECTTVAAFVFMASCILSFLSIRGSVRNGGRAEYIADILFISGLLILFVTTILFSLNVIQ